MKIYKLLRERLIRLGMPPEFDLVTEASLWLFDRHLIECKVLQSPDTMRFISIAKMIYEPMPKISSQNAHNNIFTASNAALRKGADLLERRQKQKWPKL